MIKLISFIALVITFYLFYSCSESSNKSLNKAKEDPLKGYMFLWNFSGIKETKYNYELIKETTETYEKGTAPYSIKESTIGDLIVSSNGNRNATVYVSNVENTFYSLTDENEWSPAAPRSISQLKIGDLKQYSRFEHEGLDVFWDAFLPLPLEEIKKGEQYKLKMKIPVNIEQFKYVRGTNTLTFSEYKTINNKKCVVLKGEIDVSDADKLDFQGVYKNSLKGHGTYIFDPEDHVFVNAEVEITSESYIDNTEVKDQSKKIFMNSTIKQTFKISLK